MPQFVKLRNDLKYYVSMLADQAGDNPKKAFVDRIEVLRSAINAFERDKQQEAHEEIGKQLGWLAVRRQALELNEAVRNRYSHSNLYVSVSDRLIASAVKREINLDSPFSAQVSGASITGTAVTSGTVNATLVPNKSHATVNVKFDGRSDLDATVNYGPVTVFANGAASINAGTQIGLDVDGVSVGQPWSSAGVNICVYCIQTTIPWPVKPLVLGIARSEVRRRQSEFNRTAAQRAEQEIDAQLPQQIDEIVAPINKQYRWDVKYRLRRIDAFPANVVTETTADALKLSVLQASPHQMGAPNAAPIHNAKADLFVRVHQSAVNNSAEQLLGGKTFTVRELQQLFEDLLGIPAPDEPISEGEAISITFDDKHPVAIELGNNEITVSITGKRFIASRRTYPPMSVSITYRFAEKDGEFQATLAGDPVIIPPRLKTAERKSLSLRETAIRRVLRNRLDRDLNKTIEVREIPMPAKLENLSALSITELSSETGWLTLSAQHHLELK